MAVPSKTSRASVDQTACGLAIRPANDGAAAWMDVISVLALLIAARTRSSDPTVVRARPMPLVRVSPDARCVVAPGGQRLDLSRRGALRRLVARLVEQHLASPGIGLSREQLVETGWPGQQLLPESGAMRVYVAMATLRRLGLRGLIITRDDGYLFDPDVEVRVCRSLV